MTQLVEHLPGKQKSWVRIPPEAAHFSLKKGRWVVSGVVCCLSFVLFNCLSTRYNVHVEPYVLYRVFTFVHFSLVCSYCGYSFRYIHVMGTGFSFTPRWSEIVIHEHTHRVYHSQ